MRHGIVKRLVFLAAVAASLPAWPQAASAPQLSTREEYKACRLSQDALERRRDQLDRRVERHNAAAARLQADSSEYLTSRQKKGLKTAAEVQAYNQAVARFNARNRELEAEQAGIMKEQGDYNATVLAVNGNCGGRVVSHDVKDEVERELAARTKE